MDDPRIQELKETLPRCLLHDWVRLGARLVRVLRDERHATRHDAVVDRLLERARASAALREWRAANVPRVSHPPELPITARKDEIVDAIRNHQVVVIAGETGSGKTTQIPKLCLEAGLGVEAKIACTQPRRVAALSISRRVAEELNVEWGREVGSKIRFDDRSSPQTFIKFVTDGMLLAELQADPELSEYNAIIVDEAHERSLNIDFLLGHLKGLLPRRPDLKVVVTSATIDTKAFSEAFWGAPVIEVSGRLYPVDVIYAPLDAESEERGDMTYIDAAVRATERCLTSPGSGDVLVFMPGERDIREMTEQLEGRFGREVDMIPLYGRLSSGDQQRVFETGGRPRVVVATNIAETSLTIPGIRYVIDAGLARISRYNPRTRTRRLPVEPISQSSARQRQGRAGRLQDGICIRLYSEEDFLARPAETQPEIQRANLAEVILRMKAFQLGDIETFPFLNPPVPAAIRAGYALLHELGALDERRELTPLGRDLARLPIDPTLGRMLMRSQHEHATRELLIIAAGLSIQDPRERPLDQREAASLAHRRFTDPASDFLTLLNLWDAVHDEWERQRTQNQRRRYCRAQFLSYTRMREWQDLHAQLLEALEERGTVRINESNADYGAIHRSILAGLLGHVAQRKERNVYKAAGNRELQVFPGSSLHARGEAPRKGPPDAARQPKPARSAGQPEWIVAGEVVETSQLFARTLAGVEPAWIADLAPHLCKVTHRGPHWSRSAGRVLVEEIVTLHGLEVLRRKVDYGNLEPRDATAIFVRSALVEEELLPEERRGDDRRAEREEARGGASNRPLQPVTRRAPAVPPQFGFLERNRRVRQKLENWQTRLRRHDLGDLDEAMFTFYAQRLENVSSIEALLRFLQDSANAARLEAREADLTGGRDLGFDDVAFPESVRVGGMPVPVSYAYAPGEAWDGVTIQLPADVAQSASPASVDWAVPSLRREMVAELLASLPKACRRLLQPFAPKIDEIVRDLEPSGPTLIHDLTRFIQQRFEIAIPVSEWRPDSLPSHLRPRIEISANNRGPLAAGRDLVQVRAAFAQAQAAGQSQAKAAPAVDDPAWRAASGQIERNGVTSWSFGDLPERLFVREVDGAPVYGWPGLQLEDGAVHVRLFRTAEAARAASVPGLQRLVELALGRDLAWIERDLGGLSKVGPQFAPLGNVALLESTALAHVRRHVLPSKPLSTLTAAAFQAAVEEARRRMGGFVPQLIDRVTAILQLHAQIRQKLGLPGGPAAPAMASAVPRGQSLKDFSQLGAVAVPKPAPASAPARASTAPPHARELEALIPATFLESTPFERLPHLVRYLKALQLRIERAALNPLKDRERAAQLAPYVQALAGLKAAKSVPADAREGIEELKWMLEEYRVSLFAQELGTAQPVSPKRLDEIIARLKLLAM